MHCGWSKRKLNGRRTEKVNKDNIKEKEEKEKQLLVLLKLSRIIQLFSEYPNL